MTGRSLLLSHEDDVGLAVTLVPLTLIAYLCALQREYKIKIEEDTKVNESKHRKEIEEEQISRRAGGRRKFRPAKNDQKCRMISNWGM
ncbi:hypothetical protein GOP47_0027212 [Adiantum capillus-veneris]|nr:hypothetical protein GOP47_0027212 [Adiantum capillus-veneris]